MPNDLDKTPRASEKARREVEAALQTPEDELTERQRWLVSSFWNGFYSRLEEMRAQEEDSLKGAQRPVYGTT